MPELEKSTAVAVEKMRLEEAARRKLEERLITVSHQPKDPTDSVLCITCNRALTVLICVGQQLYLCTVLHSLFMKQQPHSLMGLNQLRPSIGVCCMMCGRAGSVTWLCGVVCRQRLRYQG